MNKMISVSTEPLKNLDELLKYDNLFYKLADFTHCDVMDKAMTGRELFDFKTLKAYSEQAKLPLDIHLMCKSFKSYKKYIDLKPSILTVHYESFKDKNQLKEVLNLFRQNNIKAGVSLMYKTPFEKLKPFLEYCDLVLIMSVEIGQSGQRFNEDTICKIQECKKHIKQNNQQILIEVDGGINDSNAARLYGAGADILVSASYIYNSKDRSEAILKLKGK